jgi:hypothetical protein
MAVFALPAYRKLICKMLKAIQRRAAVYFTRGSFAWAHQKLDGHGSAATLSI